MERFGASSADEDRFRAPFSRDAPAHEDYEEQEEEEEEEENLEEEEEENEVDTEGAGGDEDEDEDAFANSDEELEEEGLGEGLGPNEEEREQVNEGICFQQDFDPLTLVHSGSNTDNLKQFKRLEYEAIAEKKRKLRAAKKSVEEIKNDSEGEERDLEEDANELFGASFEEIWEIEGFGSRKRKRRNSQGKKRGRKKGTMPPEAKKKLGEANLLYAMGKYEQAAELLEEVVRIAPNEVDTYHTLGLINETLGNHKTAFNFYMVAAHLTPDDVDLWKRLASQSMEEEDHSLSIYCLSKVVKHDPSDFDSWMSKALLLIELEDFQGAASALEYVHWAKGNKDPEVVKLLARVLYKTGKSDRAIEVLETFVRNFSEPDLTAVNILAELLMEGGKFSEASDIIEYVQKNFVLEQDFPIDLSVKCGICYGYMGNNEMAEKLFSELKKQSVADFCDLYVEIGDMYLALGLSKQALKYYEIVEGSPYYDQPTLWFKIADCHVHNNDVKSSIRVYESILEEVPWHYDARMKLSHFFITNGKFEKGVKILRQIADKPLLQFDKEIQSDENNTFDRDVEDDYDDYDDVVYNKLCDHAKMKLHLSQLYHQRGRINEFIDSFMSLLDGLLTIERKNIKKIKDFKKQLPGYKEGCLSGLLDIDILKAQKFHLFKGYMNKHMKKKFRRASRAKRRIDKLLKARGEMIKKKINDGELNPSFKNDMTEKNLELPKLKRSPLPNFFRNDETVDLIFKLCDILLSQNRVTEAAWVVEGILDSVYYLKKVLRKKLTQLSQGPLKKNKNENYLDEARKRIVQDTNDVEAWNMFHKYAPWRLGKTERHSKFLQLFRQKYPDCIPALIITANQSSISGNHQTALRDYLRAYKLNPSDPYVSLCCGIGFINLVMGSRVPNPNQCILQAFTFLYHYASLTTNQREADYNIARGYQQVGLFYLAIPYYEKLLATFLPLKNHSKPSHAPETATKASTVSLLSAPIFKDYFFHNPESDELRQKAAHNLTLIFKSSGAYDLVRKVMADHLKF